MECNDDEEETDVEFTSDFYFTFSAYASGVTDAEIQRLADVMAAAEYNELRTYIIL